MKSGIYKIINTINKNKIAKKELATGKDPKLKTTSGPIANISSLILKISISI